MNGLVYFKPSGLVRGYTPGLASGGISFDQNAADYLTAAGITDATQKAAYNTLVVTLKAYSIYSKLFALYPFLGGTAASHKWNAINPADTDGAFRLTFTGGVTHASTGITFNGTTGFADTKFNASSSGFTTTSGSFGCYCRTNTAGGYDFSCSNASDAQSTTVISRYTGNNQFSGYGTALYSVANSDGRGLFCTNRNGASNTEGYKNGSRVIDAIASVTLPSYALYLGAQNRAGSAIEFCAKEYALAYISSALSQTEQANLYTAVQAFQTALGRNV